MANGTKLDDPLGQIEPGNPKGDFYFGAGLAVVDELAVAIVREDGGGAVRVEWRLRAEPGGEAKSVVLETPERRRAFIEGLAGNADYLAEIENAELSDLVKSAAAAVGLRDAGGGEGGGATG